MIILKNIGYYLISLGSFFISIVILLVISSLIFAYTNLNDRYIDSIIYFAMAISAFISSFILCKKIKKKGLIHGVAINIIAICIIFLISCLMNKSFCITNTLEIYIAICSLTGIVGGILGVNV